MAEKSSIPDDIYRELHELYFLNGGVADKYFRGDMEPARREDIEDTFAKTRHRFAALLPEIEASDPRRVDKVAAFASFFERLGCESGIDLGITMEAQRQAADPNSPENVNRRRQELGV